MALPKTCRTTNAQAYHINELGALPTSARTSGDNAVFAPLSVPALGNKLSLDIIVPPALEAALKVPAMQRYLAQVPVKEPWSRVTYDAKSMDMSNKTGKL